MPASATDGGQSTGLLCVRFGGRVPVSPFPALMRWYDRYRQRLALAELDDRMLRDIGLTRRDARREIRKPFWR